MNGPDSWPLDPGVNFPPSSLIVYPGPGSLMSWVSGEPPWMMSMLVSIRSKLVLS